MRYDSDEVTTVFRRAWNADTPAPDSWDVEAALAQVRARDLTRPTLELHHANEVLRRRIVWLIAASVVAVSIGVTLRRAAPPARLARGEAIFTAQGERRTVRLEDGTSVMVGPRSRLEVVAGAAPERGVSLDGDAYFRVAPDSARPFLIRAGQAVIRVLGTEFAVRSYAEGSTTRVAVVEGRVAMMASTVVGSTQQSVELSAGDLGSLAPSSPAGPSSLTRVTGTDVSALVGWTRGELAFADTPLGEAAEQLERWYGVTFTIEPALTDRRVTASFTNRPIADVLTGICGAIRARCSQQGSHITIGSVTQ